MMFPVSLDCPMFLLPSVSCVPDVSSFSRLSNVLFSFSLDNLETLETSGEQDTEGRQNIGQSRDTGNIRKVFLVFPVSLDCPMFCLPSVSCFPDVSSVSRLSNGLSSLCGLCS
jgi:hypothetical protein